MSQCVYLWKLNIESLKVQKKGYINYKIVITNTCLEHRVLVSTNQFNFRQCSASVQSERSYLDI